MSWLDGQTATTIGFRNEPRRLFDVGTGFLAGPRVPPPPLKRPPQAETPEDRIEPVVQVIRRLDLEPGDVLFVSVPEDVPDRALDQFKHGLGEALGGVKVIVLAGGAKVEGVVRRCEPAVLDENAGLPVGVEDTSGWPPSTGWAWDGSNVHFRGRYIGTLR